MKKIILSIAAMAASLQGHTQTARNSDWNADLDYLARELPARHCNLFASKSRSYFSHGIEEVKALSAGASTAAVALRTQQLVAGMGDSHTRLNFIAALDRSQVLPLQLYWFSDGIFVLASTRENADIVGCKIVSVNGFPLEQVADSVGTLVTADNRSMFINAVPKLLPFVQILGYFGFTKGDGVELGLQSSDGKAVTRTVNPASLGRDNIQRCKIDRPALCYSNERALFWDSYQAADKIYYLQYNKCWSRELAKNGGEANTAGLPSFKEFEDRVFMTLKTKPVEKIVFDLRFNGGGNSLQGTSFAEKLAAYIKKNPGVKVYVVLGRVTFSSATLNALDFKRLMSAVFVGEDTGGKPSHFGEVRSFALPSSGLDVYYSTKYFRRGDGNENTIAPDVKLESAFSDFIRGVDPVYEWVAGQ